MALRNTARAALAYSSKALHKLKGTRAELDEVLSVCPNVDGGPALMYAAETAKALGSDGPELIYICSINKQQSIRWSFAAECTKS